MLIVNGEGMR